LKGVRRTVTSLSETLRAVWPVQRKTPVVRLDDDALEIYVKLESANPYGSVKDRSACWILQQAVERGDLTEGGTVIESSSGNFAISMAEYCRALGVNFIPVIDPNCNATTAARLRRLCRRVEQVEAPDASGGFLSTRLARLHQVRAELGQTYWPNQYANQDALEAHYQLTGAELCEQVPRLDHVFIGVSTGGTIAGVSRRVKEQRPGVKVIAVDAAGSAAFGMPPARRRIPGLGSSIVPELCGLAEIDEVVIVAEPDAVLGCHELMYRHGVYGGGSTGSAYAALRQYFTKHPPRDGHRPAVAFLCADGGTAYEATIYNPEWIRAEFGEQLVTAIAAIAGSVPVSAGRMRAE